MPSSAIVPELLLRFACGQCQALVNAELHRLDDLKRVCPGCGAVLKLPALDWHVRGVDAVLRSQAAKCIFPCPQCQANLQLPIERLHDPCRCRQCGTQLAAQLVATADSPTATRSAVRVRSPGESERAPQSQPFQVGAQTFTADRRHPSDKVDSADRQQATSHDPPPRRPAAASKSRSSSTSPAMSDTRPAIAADGDTVHQMPSPPHRSRSPEVAPQEPPPEVEVAVVEPQLYTTSPGTAPPQVSGGSTAAPRTLYLSIYWPLRIAWPIAIIVGGLLLTKVFMPVGVLVLYAIYRFRLCGASMPQKLAGVIASVLVSAIRCPGCGFEIDAVDRWTVGSFTDHQERNVYLAKNPMDGMLVGHIHCPQCRSTIRVR